MEVSSKSISDSRSVMTEIVLPSHTNHLGSIFGGVIVSWIDIVAVIAAQRHASRVVVTASIDTLHFIAPVYKGWIVNLKSQVNFVGKSSMEIGVRVDAEDPIGLKSFHTASAYLTMVAIDKNGHCVSVPKLELETELDRRRNKEAKKRREIRLNHKKRKR